MARRYDVNKVKEIAKEVVSIRQLLKRLDVVPAGGNYEVIEKFCKDNEIDISHFKGKSWNTKGLYVRKKLKLEDICKEGVYYSSYKLKNKLIKEGIKEWCCECCGNTTWNNQLIPLELHHINGIHTDNRMGNLQLLCPNCHAQTDNYSGKNKRKR